MDTAAVAPTRKRDTSYLFSLALFPQHFHGEEMKRKTYAAVFEFTDFSGQLLL